MTTPLPLITARARAGALDRAWTLFREGGYGRTPSDPAALAVKGRLLKDSALRLAQGERIETLGRAAAAYESADHLSPQPYLLINAAACRALAGDRAAALADAETVLARITSGTPINETPYWLAATRAEALLIMGDVAAADAALAEAMALDPDGYDDHASTLRQFGRLVSALGLDGDWLDKHRPPEIHRVDVVELHWRRGDRDRVTVHGKDCFKVLGEIGASLEEGDLTEAKLRIAFAGHHSTTAVVLKVPNRIDIKGIGIHDEVIRRLLSDVGIRGFARAAAVPDTMWSLFPYRLTEYQWRAIVGASFDDMVRGGRLRSASLEHVTHPDHPGPFGQIV